MTRSGAQAVRRYGRMNGLAKQEIVAEMARIDRVVDGLLAVDPNLNAGDRWWLEAAVRCPVATPLLAGLHYRGVPPGTTVH